MTVPFSGRPLDAVTGPVEYRLLDFGAGRKLEMLGSYQIDRPSPAADGAVQNRPEAWADADARFDEAERRWRFRHAWPEPLTVRCDRFLMPVRPTPFGHIGLFPEQADNWRWLTSQKAQPGDQALNLFGYTGASTMALVTAGFTVAHVDAAKPNVVAAGNAARLNGWENPPIRFLIDDAAKFAARERRRGRLYHTIALDPPAYGHSPRGRTWRIERDLWPLLDDVIALLPRDSFRLLVTGHSPQVGHREVVEYLKSHPALAAVVCGVQLDAGRSQLKDASGRGLDTGFVVRAQLGP